MWKLFLSSGKLVFIPVSEYICHIIIVSLTESDCRKAHSTTTALPFSTNKIFRSIIKNNSVIIISLDYSIAFDTIDHEAQN